MSAPANSLKFDDLSEATIDIVREMVRRAETKLSVLQSRRTQIRRRIQALHYLSRAFATESIRPLEKASGLESRCATEEQVREIFDTRTRSVERRSAVLQIEPSVLRRACRIALMEIERAECSAQILQRIVRRGSVSFTNHGDPLEEVTSELHRMVAEGEAVASGSGDVQEWQRSSKRQLTSSDSAGQV